MSSQKNMRVFYASHNVSVDSETGTTLPAGGVIQGAQSVGLDTTFGGEDQLFQLGRLEAYDSTLTAPEVQMTINKALDGWPLIWHHHVGAFDGDNVRLINLINAKSTARLTVGNDTDEFIGENAIHPDNKCNGGASIEMTGCFLTSFNYTFGDGVFTEEITLSGSSKDISASDNTAPFPEPLSANATSGSDGNGNVLSRQNFKQSSSILPQFVDGERISQITVSADLGNESLFQLGSFYPVMKQAALPVNITVNFDVIADTHDCVTVDIQTVGQCASPSGLTGKEPIYLEFCDSAGELVYSFDFRASDGSSTAKLNSVSYSGGDTGGGNVIITYSYIVANIMKVTYYDTAGIF